MHKPQPLTVKDVFTILIKVANSAGRQSQQEKVRFIQRLFVSSREHESRYIVRHLQGKLRIGVNEQTVFAALGRACAYTPPAIHPKIFDMSKEKGYNAEKMLSLESQNTNIVKNATAQLPNYELIIPALIKYGINDLEKHCHLTPGVPILAMLATPTKGINEILKRFANMKFTLEFKYDGERAQIHLLPDGTIKIFSRNAEDNTGKFPEIIKNCKKYIKENVKSFIIDSEIVGYDQINKKLLPFQELSRRKRKDVKEEDLTIRVCIYAFDCLYMNGDSLISQPFIKRREMLHDNFIPTDNEFAFAHHKDTSDAEEIQEFLNLAVQQSCEGLMVKTLETDAEYEPSKRSLNWLKCKKDYLDGVGDTLDLLAMGAFYGTGKRTGVYGCYLVGCYDAESEGYQSCCKVATGINDEELQRLTDKFKELIVPKKANGISKQLRM